MGHTRADTPPTLPGLEPPDLTAAAAADAHAARRERRRRALMADIDATVTEHMTDHRRHAHAAQLARRDDPPTAHYREAYLAVLCVLSAVEQLTHPLLPITDVDIHRVRSVLAQRTPT